jgi:hypothetical protein
VRHAGYIRNVLRHDDGESGIQMPVDMAVKKPWTRVVRSEPYSNVVACAASRDGISLDWIGEVVLGGPRRAYDREFVAMEVERVPIIRHSFSVPDE